jgi:LysR family transcriptional regulator, low CO2-responsive transcriptional regulator
VDTLQLRAFDQIVKDAGFSRAAWTLGIAQATVSARIAALEEEVGGALFERGRRIKLTARGVEFVEYARRALDLIDAGIRAAATAAGQTQQRLDIAVSGSLAGGCFAIAISEFIRKNPKVTINARMADCDEITRFVRDGTVSLGLIPWPMIGANDLRALWSFNEALVPVVSPSHPLARRKNITIEDFRKLAHPLYPVWFDDVTGKRLSVLTSSDQAPVELPLQSVLSLVKSGHGAAFITQALVAEDIKLGNLVAISLHDFPILKRKYGLVSLRKNSHLTDLHLEFSALARAVIVTNTPSR